MDNGKLSTLIVTISVLVLGVFVADPTLLPRILPVQLQVYVPIFAAILVAVYNYLNPRQEENKTEEQA